MNKYYKAGYSNTKYQFAYIPDMNKKQQKEYVKGVKDAKKELK